MSEVDVDALLARGLVEAYWVHYRQADSGGSSSQAAANSWAWEAVHELTSSQHRRVVEVIEQLADQERDDLPALAYLGAGAVEDLLRHHGPPAPSTVAELDAAAERNPAVALAVRCVWWSEDDDPALVARFTRFGPPH